MYVFTFFSSYAGAGLPLLVTFRASYRLIILCWCWRYKYIKNSNRFSTHITNIKNTIKLLFSVFTEIDCPCMSIFCSRCNENQFPMLTALALGLLNSISILILSSKIYSNIYCLKVADITNSLIKKQLNFIKN